MATRLSTLPSSAFDPPPPPPSQWWSQLHALYIRRKNLTKKEAFALLKPECYGLLTFLVIMSILVSFAYYIDSHSNCHVDVSVKSISVSLSSTATWHVDLLVRNHRSRYAIIYDDDYLYAKLGSFSGVVLNTSHTGLSRGLTSFSVDFVTSNQSFLVSASPPRVLELDIKIRAKKKQYIGEAKIGHLDIKCQDLLIGHENIKCDSSFKKLEWCC